MFLQPEYQLWGSCLFFWLAKINTTLFLPASLVLIGINSARTRQREGRYFQMTFKDEKGDCKRGIGGRQILDMALGILADTRIHCTEHLSICSMNRNEGRTY